MFLKIAFLLCLMVIATLSISEKPSKIPEGTLDAHNDVTNSSMIPEELREKDGGMLLSKFFDKLSKKQSILIYAHPPPMDGPPPPPGFFPPQNSTENENDRHSKFFNGFGFGFGTPFWGAGPYGWAGW